MNAVEDWEPFQIFKMVPSLVQCLGSRMETTVKPVLSSHSKIKKNKTLKPCGSLMQVSDFPPRKPFFGLLFSGPLRPDFTPFQIFKMVPSLVQCLGSKNGYTSYYSS